MAGKLRMPRSRGAISGFLLVLLGAWGGLIAFIGPYFHYAYTPATAWSYNTNRLWLEILPGVATLVGGLIVLGSRLRPVAMLGAWLAAIGGAWFAVGTAMAPLWTHGAAPAQGTPVGGTVARAVEQIGFFSGLGVAVVFVAAAALGRLVVRHARDIAVPPSGKHATPVPTTDDEPAPARKPVAAAIMRRIGSARTPAPGPTQERTEPADIGS